MRRGIGAAALLLAAAPVWAQAKPPPDPRAALALLFLLPVALCSFTALQVVLWVLAPGPLSAACRAILRGRGWCLLTGLVAAAVALALASTLGKYPGAGGAAGALVLGVTALGALVGIAAVAALIGQSAVELAGRTASRALEVVVGAALLGLTAICPIVGWVLGIYFVLVGLGGALQALGRSK